MNAEYLERCLFEFGKASLLKTEKYGFINAKAVTNGELNIYMLPSKINCFSTDSLRFFLSGSSASRIDKLMTLADYPEEAAMAAEYVDILQIPAFLCRQTDLLVAAAKTGKIVNIKKGQFLSPGAMRFAADKVVEAGNSQVMLTERGTTFGYQDLLVDYRGIPEMQTFGHPVVLDVTHSLQQPNQTSGVTGGMPALIETVAKAGVAVGVDGLFMETHEDPSVAKSDGANMLKLDLLEGLLEKLVRIRQAIR